MFFDNLQKLCLEKNTTVTAVLKALNISTSKGTAWKNGSVPNGEIVKLLASYFDVSTDYLLGNETKKENPSLTRDEFEEKALELFRKLSLEEKKAFLQFMQANRGESK